MAILLLDVPGLHLGYLGYYGNPWVATPNLDRLASEGVVFDRHFAAGPGSLGTGRYRFPSLTDTDEGAGGNWFSYRTELVQFVRPNEYARTSATLGSFPGLTWVELPTLAAPWSLSSEILASFVEDDSNPLTDPPAKLAGGDDDLRRLQNSYAAVVTRFDSTFGELLEALEQSGRLDEVLLIITSQYSLPLAEHGWVGIQRAWQHEEQVHLPLLMRLPGAAEAGLRIGALTQSVDIIPTLLETLGIPASGVHGLSLWPLIRQEVSEIRPFACSGDRVGNSVEWSLRTLDRAFLLPISVPEGDPPRRPQLYIKPDDRWEVNDVIHHHSEQAAELEKALREFAAK